MIDYMVNNFVSFFQNPSASGTYLAIAIGLAIAFGAVWLAGYRPPLFKKPWLWAVLVSSPFLTLAAISFIQIPLQVWAGQRPGMAVLPHSLWSARLTELRRSFAAGGAPYRCSNGNLCCRHSCAGNGLGPVAPLEKKGSYG